MMMKVQGWLKPSMYFILNIGGLVGEIHQNEGPLTTTMNHQIELVWMTWKSWLDIIYHLLSHHSFLVLAFMVSWKATVMAIFGK